MSIIKMNNDRIVCPEGSHNAVLAAVFSLGLQVGFKDEKPKPKHVYMFELGKKIPSGPLEGEPYIISGIYTDSPNEKSRLSEVIRALKGELTVSEIENGFNPESMIGLGCTIVTNNQIRAGKTMPSIVSIIKRESSMPLLVPTLDRSKVPDWVKKMQDQRLDKPNSVNNAA